MRLDIIAIDKDSVYTEVGLSKVLGVSKMTLYRMRNNGLPFRRFGKAPIYKGADVLDFLLRENTPESVTNPKLAKAMSKLTEAR